MGNSLLLVCKLKMWDVSGAFVSERCRRDEFHNNY